MTRAAAKPPVTALELALACAHAADERKAVAPVLLDLRGASSVADYFLVVSGRSDTQVRAIAEGIDHDLRALGARPLAIEGSRLGQWILLDYADVVVHVFYEATRQFYDLEHLWAQAPHVPLPPAMAAPTTRPTSPPHA